MTQLEREQLTMLTRHLDRAENYLSSGRVGMAHDGLDTARQLLADIATGKRRKANNTVSNDD